ncbi:hypothetical protein NMG60_11008415 [Bertholletia excelsa]
MVVTESEVMSQGEVESPLQSDQQPKNHALPSLGRQSSIYSLTLDEFQHTLCGSGKNFGSMNMDEFLNSIWAAEEIQAHFNSHAQAQAQAYAQAANNSNSAASANESHSNLHFLSGDPSADKGIAKQPSLPRQGSFTIPAPLCRKTVDEVWSEIHKSQQEQQRGGGGGNSDNVQNAGSTHRQPTFGEMTLEDFLIRAGVVREQANPPVPARQQPYGIYPNNHNPGVGQSFGPRPIMAVPPGTGGVNMPMYQPMPQGGVGVIGESSVYVGNGKRSGGYPPPPPAVCYGGRVGNGGGGGGGWGGGGASGGYAQVQGLGIGSPVSPASSDGIGVNQLEGSNQYGLDMGGIRGARKRIIDGPVEKVVERRQRRMIKNRESAARSRARKQAYTVELEAELNQLREENAQLKQALAELERKRKQQSFEEAKRKPLTRTQRAREKLQAVRRSSSCPL